MTRFYLSKSTLLAALNVLPPLGETWLELDVEHNLLRISRIDRDFAVYSYTDTEIVVEGEQPEHGAKYSMDSMQVLLDLLATIEDDKTTLTLAWGEPQADKIKMTWRENKRTRQCTMTVIIENAPTQPVFNLAESIELDPVILKVLNIHASVAHRADDDLLAGVFIRYDGPAEKVEDTTVTVYATDQVRVLQSEVSVAEVIRYEPAKLCLPEYGAKTASKRKGFDTVRLDLANGTWEMYQGNNRVVIRTILKEQSKEPNYAMLSAPSRPDGSAFENACVFRLDALKFKFGVHFASRITSDSKAIALTPKDDLVEFSGVHSENGYSRTDVPTIGAVEGVSHTVNLSAKLLQAAADLMDREDVVDITLNPVAPCLIEFHKHGFAVMPMTFREVSDDDKDEDTDE